MKKGSLLTLCIVFLLPCISCKNEKDGPEIPHVIPESPFVLEEITSTSPLTVLYYDSPDPGCGIPKDYSIYTGYEASELVLKCLNFDKIQIDYSNSYFGPAIVQANDDPKNWAYVIDENEIIIKFPYLEAGDDIDLNTTYSLLMITASGEDGMVSDGINIYRALY